MIPFASLYPLAIFAAGLDDSFTFEGMRNHADGPFASAFALKLRSLHRDGRIERVSSMAPIRFPETEAWNDFAATGQPSAAFLTLFGVDLVANAFLDVEFDDPHQKKPQRIEAAHTRLCATVDHGNHDARWRFDRLFDPHSKQRFVLALKDWRASLMPYQALVQPALVPA